MKGKKLIALLLAVLMLTALLTGCGGASTEAMDMAANGSAVESPAMEEVGVEEEVLYSSTGSTASTGTGSSTSVDASQQKLIRRVNMDAETEDLEALLPQLTAQVGELGGYIESQELYNGSSYSSRRSRWAYLSIRIPADKLDRFVSQVNGLSNVVSYNESAEDVTLTYVATESRVKALETEQERLLELLSKAETMSDLLEIEERLTDVRAELESVTTQLRTLSNKVNYATVSLSIEQVEVYTEVDPPTVWQRISGGFTENLKDLGDGLVDFFVWVVTYSPQLLFWAVVITAAVIGWKRTAKKRKARKSSQVPPYYPPPQEGEEKK